MAQFNVNSDELAVKSQAVHGSMERIRAEVDAMTRNLSDLQSTWTGSASNNFQVLVNDWRATQMRVEASLESINAALAAAAAHYATAEEENARMFTTR